jgi:cyanophycinase
VSLPLQPIYLLADSQLLFWRNGGLLFLDSIRNRITTTAPKAAFLGASSGDDPDSYSIFEAAMEGIEIHDRRMILSSFPSDDELFINNSDVIVLGGGNVERGWSVFNEVGLNEVIIRRYYEGALLIGISAGAVQLGLFGVVEVEESFNTLIDTFKLVPFVISAHEEKQEWKCLKDVIELLDGASKGIGIPTGGGLAYYSDQSIEAIRHPVHEFAMRDQKLIHSLLLPTQVH